MLEPTRYHNYLDYLADERGLRIVSQGFFRFVFLLEPHIIGLFFEVIRIILASDGKPRPQCRRERAT
jgi:hypothetical protein